MSDYFLLDNPPARPQFRTSRRARPTGLIVLHTTESPPDVVGPDTGAENVARFIQRRPDPGCYHALADSDSMVRMVPWSYETFHDGTGSNAWSIGISAATQAHRWPELSAEWRDRTVTNMADLASQAASWLTERYGIVVPARRVSRVESEQGQPGFISHGERDPGRRSDPGAHFPWTSFLATFAALYEIDAGPANNQPEAPVWAGMLTHGQFLLSGNGRYMLIHQPDGNVVLYNERLQALWSTNTQGRTTVGLVMQGDGNLVLYGEGGGALWASGSHRSGGGVLAVQNDGNLVIYGPGNDPIWSLPRRR